MDDEYRAFFQDDGWHSEIQSKAEVAVDCVHSCYTTMTHRNWSMIEYVAEEVRWWLNELSEESNETRVAEHRDEEVFKVRRLKILFNSGLWSA